MRKRGLVSTRF